MNEEAKSQERPEDKPKIPAQIHIACGWPLLLVAIGGALGGLLGGLAYGINLTLYRSSLPRVAVWILNPVIGIAAIVLWLVIGVLIHSAIS